jgi:cell division initiation protein
MIDITPLDVRNKRGDFKKSVRGYDAQEVDLFLELVAERLESLVREGIQLRERVEALQGQVNAQSGREQAVQDALVTAQELRAEIQNQARREAEHIVNEAQAEARQILAAADTDVRDRLRSVERRLDQGQSALDDLERRRTRFIREFKGLLEREIELISIEEGRAPLERASIGLDPGVSSGAGTEAERGAVAGSGDEQATFAAPGNRGPDADATHVPPSNEGIPDLETVLAEAGIEGSAPPAGSEDAPPPAQAIPRHDPLTFNPDDNDGRG